MVKCGVVFRSWPVDVSLLDCSVICLELGNGYKSPPEFANRSKIGPSPPCRSLFSALPGLVQIELGLFCPTEIARSHDLAEIWGPNVLLRIIRESGIDTELV